MNQEEAVAAARRAITDTFVVTNTASFYDEREEAEEKISLNTGEEGVPTEGTTGDGVWYVTLSFDSVEGEGDFRATARVTADGAKVVDFEAGDLT